MITKASHTENYHIDQLGNDGKDCEFSAFLTCVN